LSFFFKVRVSCCVFLLAVAMEGGEEIERAYRVDNDDVAIEYNV